MSDTQKRPRGGGAAFSHGPGGPGMIGTGRGAKDTRATLRRLWTYLKQQRFSLFAVFVLVAVSTLLGTLGPYLMGRAIDKYIIPGDIPGLARIALLMAGIYVVTSAMMWGQTYLMAWVAQRTVRNIRRDLFAKLQSLSLRFFDRRPHGELMSRLTNDVENVSSTLTDATTQFLSGGMTVVAVAGMMLALNVRLALVTLITIPFMFYLLSWASKHTRRGFRAQQQHLGELNGIIEETITGQRVVKAYGQEQAALDKFEVSNRQLQAASVHAQTYALLLGPLSNLVNNTGLAIVAGVGGWMALMGWATIGMIASFVSYARHFTRPLNQIAQVYNMIQSALAGAERVFELLDEVPELDDVTGAYKLEDVRGDVVFDSVDFSYDDGVPVLRNVSLHAEPGQTVALVGPTGAGKTTIVNLLTRFYDIDAGRISIDGHDIRQVTKDSLRQSLGIVLQDTFLFSDTVMENIRYGRLDATDEEVISAARLANADHFIRHLPQGYDTPLSEQGGNLSQGQRQLLSIARAVLADPAILVLDEATSSVDTRTEVRIQEALLRLMEGRTSFVIAHRLSTIRNADQVLVVHGGEIIERGTHRDLLDARGFYHNLYVSQFKGTAVELAA